MRLPRVRFKVWQMMIAVVLVALILAALELQERRRFAIALKATEADYQNAKLTREVAAIAVVEYEHGIFPSQLQQVNDEIADAATELKRAQVQLADAPRSIADSIARKVSLQQKQFAYQKALTSKQVLEKYTKAKTVKELQSEVSKARAQEMARKSAFERVKATGGSLIRRIMNWK
jgi:hypothetical protein